MRAALLAAGLGTRLRPLTDRLPKCLMPVHGRPLLGHWLDLLAAYGVDEVLVNTHHFAEHVASYVATRGNSPAVTLSHEPELLGSAGTLRANRDFFDDGEPFFVGYADTLVAADLSALRRTHASCGAVATLGLFRAADPRACGIAELRADGIIASFVEKPVEPASDLAFAGVMVAGTALFDYIPEKSPVDVGGDVLPRLAGRMAGWLVDGYVRDIGTVQSYAEAQIDFPLATPAGR